MRAIISTVKFDRKDLYDAEHDLLPIAKFLIIKVTICTVT